MQCHKPGHRASARCVSALLAAGALLATVADQFVGTSERPAMRAVALETPAPDSARAAHEQVLPMTADLSALAFRETRPARFDRHAARSPVWDSDDSGHWRRTKHWRWAARHRPAERKRMEANWHTRSYLLAHLPAATNQKAAQAVHEALSLMGVPYRWGGTTRAGFDCSGFTQHVWAVAGVKIPRTVREQARVGTHISLNKAEPGDLVVFYPTQHHVGIYVGSGLVIDSPHTGSWVRPDPVRSMPVSAVIRVVKA